MSCLFGTVFTAVAFTVVSALNAKLEAFAVPFPAARFLTCASLAMLVLHIRRVIGDLLLCKGLRVAFHNLPLCLLNHLPQFFAVLAAGAATLGTANLSLGEALTVKFEASTLGAGAFTCAFSLLWGDLLQVALYYGYFFALFS